MGDLALGRHFDRLSELEEQMTIVTFALGIILVAVGVGSLVASFNLLPTELGLLYAACGAIFVCGGAVTLAIGVVVLRLEALTHVVRFAAAVDDQPEEAAAHAAEPLGEDLPEHEPVETTAEAEAESGEAPQEEAPQVETPPEGRAAETASVEAASVEAPGAAAAPAEDAAAHAPSVADLAQALAAPEAAPTLVGHYSAGGANYKIFSDGSIEAETEGGAFRFASMAEFKSYLASARA
jgi:hypothetical protein